MTSRATLIKGIRRIETKKRAIEREYKSPKDMWYGHKIGMMQGRIEILRELLETTLPLHVSESSEEHY